MAANQKGLNKKLCSQKEGVSVIEHSQPKGVTPNMIERKLRIGVKG
jgi:hypothetical protein